MRISEIIEELEVLKHKYGDLPVVTEDGMDPSDPSEVMLVELKADTRWFDADVKLRDEPAIFIHT